MEIKETHLKGCYTLQPWVFTDDRGYFFESYNQKAFTELTGYSTEFVQDNQSLSSYGTLRGLHYQRGPHAQAKLVRVIEGRVLDVAVDLRKESSTYGQWFSVELTGKNNLQLFIPRGFAHGFSVLSETAIFSYKCDNFYHKASEAGIRYDDPALAIDWQIPKDKMRLSEKDLLLPYFNA